MADASASTSGDHPSQAANNSPVPAASNSDSQLDSSTVARKPRDARMLHIMLQTMGVSSYHERVPLMLMDFAYRYTSSILQDALLFSDTINSTSNTGGQNPPANISTDDLRMSIASRVNHQFNPGLPKEFLLEVAQERNKVALPTVQPEFGVRLPPEKYCLTGINWDLMENMDEWAEISDEDDEDGDVGGGLEGGRGAATGSEDDQAVKMEEDDDDENLFGGGGDADTTMADA